MDMPTALKAYLESRIAIEERKDLGKANGIGVFNVYIKSLAFLYNKGFTRGSTTTLLNNK